MNKAYVILPIVLLAAFIAVQRPAQRRIEAAAQAHAAQQLHARAAADAQKLAAQNQAAEAARLRAAEHDEKERLKAETKQRAYAALLHRLEEETVAIVTTTTRLAAELAELDRQLVSQRDQHEAADRAVFALAQKLEHQRTARRTSDLELQRTATMLAQRVAESSWFQTQPQTPPAP